MKRDPKLLGWGILFALLAGAGVSFTSLARHAQESAPPLQLVLNIRANRLDVYEAGERTRMYEVSVGKRPYHTPPGRYRIPSVLWNPWWHPPDSKRAEGWKPAPPGPNNPMELARPVQASVRREVLQVLQEEGIDVRALGHELPNRITMKRNATRLTLPLDTLVNSDRR